MKILTVHISSALIGRANVFRKHHQTGVSTCMLVSQNPDGVFSLPQSWRLLCSHGEWREPSCVESEDEVPFHESPYPLGVEIVEGPVLVFLDPSIMDGEEPSRVVKQLRKGTRPLLEVFLRGGFRRESSE